MRAESSECGVDFIDHLGGIESFQIVALEDFVRFGDAMGNLCFGKSAIEEVGHAQAAAVDLVGVGRTNAAFGGADLAIAERCFACGVEFLVKGHHHMGAVGDEKLLGCDRNPL